MDQKTHILASPRYTTWGTYILDVPAPLLSIPERVLEFADRTEFKQKQEYHVTLAGRKIMALIEGTQSADELMDLINDIPEWKVTLKNKYYLLAKKDSEGNTKQSIIQMVDLPQIEEFYLALAKDNILEVSVPPAHITLFTKYDEDGIAIYSQEEFDDYLIREVY